MSDASVFCSQIAAVEIGERVSAGACGSLLAQLGVHVVLVEPSSPSPRHDLKWSAREQFVGGKQSIVLDDQSDSDPRLLERIVAAADVIITSSDVDRLQVVPAHSDQIHCDVTAFGGTGPLAGKPYSDLQIQALSAMLDTTGLPGTDPVPIGGAAAEFLTALHAAASVLAALRVRRRDGFGQRVDMALFDCAYSSIATFLPKWLDDPTANISRLGNRHALASPWNVYPANDGWVLICTASDAQWLRLCDVMKRPDLAADPGLQSAQDRGARGVEIDAEIARWTRARVVTQCIDALSAVNIACGPVAPIDGSPREANLAHRGMVLERRDEAIARSVYVAASPVNASETPGIVPTRIPAPDAHRDAVRAWAEKQPGDKTRARSDHRTRPPLAGIRVIEIGHYTTAPLAGRHLASLGADVIKVEPPGGEAMRGWRPARHGLGLFFAFNNAGKRSIALDLRSESGARTLTRLIEHADVLIENLKPGSLARMGFSWDALQDVNERLIYCAISGFGQHSLYPGRPAFDTVVQAMAGTMAITEADGIPVKAGISIADLMGASLSVVEIIAALEHRERSGRGQMFDLAMQDVTAWATQLAWNGRWPLRVPVSFIRCADGLVVVEGVGARDAIGSADDDTRERCVHALESLGYVAAPVLRVNEVAAHPQANARELLRFVRDSDGREWPMLASPLERCTTEPAGPLGREAGAIIAEVGLDA